MPDVGGAKRRSVVGYFALTVVALFAISILAPLLGAAALFLASADEWEPGFVVSTHELRQSGDGVVFLINARFVVTILIAWVTLRLWGVQDRMSYLGARRLPSFRQLAVWLSVQTVVTLVVVLIPDGSESGGQSGWSERTTQSATLLTAFLASICLLGPLSEELFYRGLALGAVCGRRLSDAAVFAVVLLWSCVWASEHGGSALMSAVLFVSAVTLSAARLATGSLWTPCLMHVGHNAFTAVGILNEW
jgi:membrane protease YdiL (CAAX protease family)